VQTLSAVIVVFNLVLCLIVGLRLATLARRSGALPERVLAIYFLASPFVGAVAQCAAYAGLSDPSLRLSDSWTYAALAISTLSMGVGAAAIFVFTWKTFRPESRAARAVVATACITLCVGFALEVYQDGFELMILPGTGHWLAWLGRVSAFAWLSFECFRHWMMLRRRLRLGLARALVVNRFLLWGLFSAATFAVLWSDLAARVAYVLQAGTSTEILIEVAAPIVDVTLAVTMFTGMVSAATLVLAFFPTPAYRGWIERRTEAQPA
jgi:hypothetical protein